MKKILFNIMFLMILIFTIGCQSKPINSENESIMNPVEPPQDQLAVKEKEDSDSDVIMLEFPKLIELDYGKIALDKTSHRDVSNWTYQKSLVLGKLGNNPIMIDLYTDENDYLYGIVKTETTTLVLDQLGYAHNIEDMVTFDLQSKYSDGNVELDLIGIIGSYVLGYSYVFYNQHEYELLSFHNWGYPELYDLDQDGTNEIITQFEGQHLNMPDVYIYKWKDGSFHSTRISQTLSDLLQNDQMLDFPSNWISSTYELNDDIEVTVGFIEKTVPSAAKYQLKIDQLILKELIIE